MEPEDLSDEEILPEARFYQFRAQRILQMKDQALRKVFEKTPDDLGYYKTDEDEKKPKKPRGKKPNEKKAKKPCGKKPNEEKTKKPHGKKPIQKMQLPSNSKESRKRIQEQSHRQIAIEYNQALPICDAVEKEMECHPQEHTLLEKTIIIKFKYLSDMSKLTVKMRDTFDSIYDRVANMLKLQASEILLCFRDQTIKPTETPLSLNLKYFDIIECLPYKLNDVMEFFVKMQSNDIRRKIDVPGSRFEEFKGYMERYAEIRNIPMKGLSFKFDGEKIEESKTPEDLEMESGSCIDVQVVVESTTVDSDSDVEIIAEIVPESNRLQICVLD